MIERCLCVYALCHICVFEKKCCLSVQNTELQLKNLTCHLLIMCLILLINVHEAVLACSKYVWLPCGYHCSRPLLKCAYAWLPIINPHEKSVATKAMKTKKFSSSNYYNT